jgi:hypothetical protein
VCLFSGVLFGQEYPEIINNGTVLINTGIGYGKTELDDIEVPPLMLSLDYALPIASLPFTVGLGGIYSAEKDSVEKVKNLALDFRLAYHLGFGIRRLDISLMLAGGGIIQWFDDEDSVKGKPWFWAGLGGRYFFKPNLGVFTELGFGAVYNISLGAAFLL